MEKKVIDAETKKVIEGEETKKGLFTKIKETVTNKDNWKKAGKGLLIFGAGAATGILGSKIGKHNDDDIVDAEVTEEEVYTSEF